MSTAIDPHLIVLCISKSAQHLRTTVRRADLSTQPGLKLPSGNPSNSSYVHSHIWKGGRTRRPQGFACEVGQAEQACAPFYQEGPFKEKPETWHTVASKYYLDHGCMALTFYIVILKITFETSIPSTMILSSSDSIWNDQWAATAAQFHLSTDKCSDGMSIYVQPIVTPLCCSRSICVTRQQQFESLSLQRHNHHNSESTQDNLMKLMIFT